MKMTLVARCVGVALLVLVSTVPQFITGVVVGGFNLMFLLALWVILVICFLRMNRRWAMFLALIGGLVMAVPPVPYYLLLLEDGFKFHFIGWNNVDWGTAYGVLFNLAFYVLMFSAAAFLLHRRPLRLDSD